MSFATRGGPDGGDVASVLAALRAEGAAIVDELLERNANHWESASSRDRQGIEEVARSVVDRLLSEPAERAARFSGDDGGARAEALRELFGLAGRRPTTRP
jgi:glutamyl-tRNA reductase